MIVITIIIIIHLLFIIFRDNQYVKSFKKFKDPEIISINDLKNIPLVNIIVPAWNEGDLFMDCLNSFSKLSYPKLKIIVNAGGNEKTIKNAESFKNDDRFIILRQKAGRGKINALNDCLPYVSEGIVYMVDADTILSDETLLRMIYPIVNLGEHVVIGGIRPLPHQENKDLVKYLRFNRYMIYRFKFRRYQKISISGANTCVSYEVIKSIGKFTPNRNFGEDTSRAIDILSKGYKIYSLTHYEGQIYSYYPDTLKKWIKQKIIWNENNIMYSIKNKKIKRIIRRIIISLYSIFLLISPLLFFIHPFFLLLAFYTILNLYLLKIRKLIFYRKCIDKKYYTKYSILFFFKIYLYVCIEILIHFYIFIEVLLFGEKKLKKRNFPQEEI
ncbi:MAG: glycosyltransferase [Candidatus Helarchaeota archaeon]